VFHKFLGTLTLEVQSEAKLVSALVEVLSVDVGAEREVDALTQAVRQTKTKRTLVVDLRAEGGVLVDDEDATDAELSRVVRRVPVDRNTGMEIRAHLVERGRPEHLAIVDVRVEDHIIVGVAEGEVARGQPTLRGVEAEL